MREGKSLKAAVILALCLGLFIDASCKRQATSSGALFPATNEVAGWERSGDVRSFESADLWKYIDGDAERYLKAGTERVSTVDYKLNKKIDAVVDIYTMANSDGAAKIFDSEPAGDAKPIQLGDDARLYGQSLVFRKGRDLVRIVAYADSAGTSVAIVQLGESIERRLKE